MFPKSIINHTKFQKKAIQLLKDEIIYDLIMLDGKLQDGHGRNILANISKSNYHKVIVFTGDEIFVDEAKKKEIFSLLKACNIPELKNYIEEFLTGKLIPVSM